MKLEQFEGVGGARDLARVDAPAKVKGEALYGADLQVAGMLYGLPVLTPVPCGEIAALDTSAARACPGVVAVLTAADVPGKNALGGGPLPQPVLCEHQVRFAGDVVALIAAETPEAAEVAARLIRVEVRPATCISSLEEAIAGGRLEPFPTGDLLNHRSFSRGDLEAAWAEAACVIQETYRTPSLEHLYLEPEVCLSLPEPGGSLILYGATQEPFTVREVVSQVLGIEERRVRFKSLAMGGGFGGKAESSFLVCAQAALLSHVTGRPVRLQYDRAHSMTATTKRHAAVLKYKTAAAADGRLLGLQAEIYLDKGAYTAGGGLTPPAFNRAFLHATGPYAVPAVRVEVYLVRTNNPPGGQMRSPGVPQVTFAMESQMDRIARALDLDPLRVRALNLLRRGGETAYGFRLGDDVAVAETLEEASQAFGWDWEQAREQSAREGKRVGIGVACGWHGVSLPAGVPDSAEALVHLNSDGTFTVRTGLCELGQGLRTVLARLAAHALAVDISRVEIALPDTDIDPYSGKTTSSRATVTGGNAVLRACEEARHNLCVTAATLFGCPQDQVEITTEGVKDRRSGGHLSFAELAKRSGGPRGTLIGHAWWSHPDPVQPSRAPGYRVWSFGTHIVQVQVDLETGKVEVQRVVAAHDPGKVLDPGGIAGQIEGGVAMGLGFALSEQLLTKEGRVLNPTLRDYTAALAPDVPVIETVLIERPYEQGPLGAKGIGEIATVPTAAAVANAVSHALGVPVDGLPLTPERVLEFCKASRGIL